MDLKAEILFEHSKRQTMKIVEYVGNDEVRFAELMRLFFHGGNRITQRAAWAVAYCAQAHPGLIGSYLEEMLTFMQQPVHEAVIRNTLKILSEIALPENLMGKIADLAFHFLEKPDSSIAAKVYSIYIIGKFCKSEPDLIPELKLIIESQLPMASPAFKACSRNVLKGLQKRK